MLLFSWDRWPHASREFYIWNLKKSKINLVTSCKVVSYYDDKILLINNHRWRELPWWHLEIWETTEECAKREVYEESWYSVSNLKQYGYLKVTNTVRKINKVNGESYPPISFVLYYTWNISKPHEQNKIFDSNCCWFFKKNSEEAKLCSEYMFFSNDFL